MPCFPNELILESFFLKLLPFFAGIKTLLDVAVSAFGNNSIAFDKLSIL